MQAELRGCCVAAGSALQNRMWELCVGGKADVAAVKDVMLVVDLLLLVAVMALMAAAVVVTSDMMFS